MKTYCIGNYNKLTLFLKILPLQLTTMGQICFRDQEEDIIRYDHRIGYHYVNYKGPGLIGDWMNKDIKRIKEKLK